ncbi:MAG: ribonuclease HI family protein [Spirochaetia bacterium]|nr:ribonuclease HI family protein [Spirochaetia bacterium]
MNYYVFTDGASKGNPGQASVGAVCFLNEVPDLNEFKRGYNPVFSISESIGYKTNNEAEYHSLLFALEKLFEKQIKEAQIFMDSELVVKQLNGQYKVKNENLKTLWLRVNELARKGKFVFRHVPREKNSIADYLANLAFKS